MKLQLLFVQAYYVKGEAWAATVASPSNSCDGHECYSKAIEYFLKGYHLSPSKEAKYICKAVILAVDNGN